MYVKKSAKDFKFSNFLWGESMQSDLKYIKHWFVVKKQIAPQLYIDHEKLESVLGHLTKRPFLLAYDILTENNCSLKEKPFV